MSHCNCFQNYPMFKILVQFMWRLIAHNKPLPIVAYVLWSTGQMNEIFTLKNYLCNWDNLRYQLLKGIFILYRPFNYDLLNYVWSDQWYYLMVSYVLHFVIDLYITYHWSSTCIHNYQKTQFFPLSLKSNRFESFSGQNESIFVPP